LQDDETPITIDNNVVIPPDDEDDSKSDITGKLNSFHLRSEAAFKIDKEKVKKLERINMLKEEKSLAGPAKRTRDVQMPPAIPKPLRSMGTQSSVGGGYGASKRLLD
jgi:hypothetical protein